MTMTRLWMSTWVAARPTPGAAYMVSAMSLINLRISVIDALDPRGHLVQTRIRIAQNGQ